LDGPANDLGLVSGPLNLLAAFITVKAFVHDNCLIADQMSVAPKTRLLGDMAGPVVNFASESR
jgi:hypothetical protein